MLEMVASRSEAVALSTLDKFIADACGYAGTKKRWLIDEFGIDDYAIAGMVVVGSVAAGTEHPGSDIDICLLTIADGDLDDFTDALNRLSDRRIDIIDVISLDQGAKFVPKDWTWLDDEKGYHNTAYTVVMFEPNP